MAPGGVKLHKVGEDEALLHKAEGRGRPVHAVHVVLRVDGFGDSLAVKDVLDLAHGVYRLPGFLQAGEQVVRFRLAGEVPAVGRTDERIAFPDKGTGDDPRHVMVPGEDFAGDAALPVQLLRRIDAFVAGNLEHAVRRGVDDRFPRPAVFLAQLIDDRRTRGDSVVQDARHAGTADILVDNLLREPVRIYGEAFRRIDAHHLPVADGRIFAGAHFLQPPKGALRLFHGLHALHSVDIPVADTAHVRNFQVRIRLHDMADGVAANVVKIRGVRRLAHAHAVQHNPDDPAHIPVSFSHIPVFSFPRMIQRFAKIDKMRIFSCFFSIYDPLPRGI